MLVNIFSRLILRKRRPPWFVNDACGRICAYITWFLIFWAWFVVYYVIIPPWIYADSLQTNAILTANNQNDKKTMLLLEHFKSIKSHQILSTGFVAFANALVFGICSLFALIAHVRAMLSDPGVTDLNNASPECIARMNLPSGYVLYKCVKCSAIKPERAHHCSVCRRCVKRMDHHCPWINNCVGEKNQKYFVLFTLYICIVSAHAICMIVSRFITCSNYNWKTELCSTRSPGFTIMCLISLAFEACLFFLFTAIMFGTQMYSICIGETGIEQLKNDANIKAKYGNLSKWRNLKAVFGDKVSFRWFLPFIEPQWAKGDLSLYCV